MTNLADAGDVVAQQAAREIVRATTATEFEWAKIQLDTPVEDEVGGTKALARIAAIIASAIRSERERCAKIADTLPISESEYISREIAAAIRKGEKKHFHCQHCACGCENCAECEEKD